jgi:hypothetical protein
MEIVSTLFAMFLFKAEKYSYSSNIEPLKSFSSMYVIRPSLINPFLIMIKSFLRNDLPSLLIENMNFYAS